MNIMNQNLKNSVRNEPQNQSYNIKSGQGEIYPKITNCHVPLNAIDYLQMVDEPGAERVVQKFANYEYQDTFKNPLGKQQETIFLAHMKSSCIPKRNLTVKNSTGLPGSFFTSPSLSKQDTFQSRRRSNDSNSMRQHPTPRTQHARHRNPLQKNNIQ